PDGSRARIPTNSGPRAGCSVETVPPTTAFWSARSCCQCTARRVEQPPSATTAAIPNAMKRAEGIEVGRLIAAVVRQVGRSETSRRCVLPLAAAELRGLPRTKDVGRRLQHSTAGAAEVLEPRQPGKPARRILPRLQRDEALGVRQRPCS